MENGVRRRHRLGRRSGCLTPLRSHLRFEPLQVLLLRVSCALLSHLLQFRLFHLELRFHLVPVVAEVLLQSRVRVGQVQRREQILRLAHTASGGAGQEARGSARSGTRRSGISGCSSGRTSAKCHALAQLSCGDRMAQGCSRWSNGLIERPSKLAAHDAQARLRQQCITICIPHATLAFITAAAAAEARRARRAQRARQSRVTQLVSTALIASGVTFSWACVVVRHDGEPSGVVLLQAVSATAGGR